MRSARGWMVLVACSVSLLVLLCSGIAPSRASGMGEQKFKVGDKAPEFGKSAFLDGKEPKLADLAGKRVLLLNFWGLRCGACLEEMPYLEEIAKKYADQGLTVWGVDTDGVDAQTVRDTLKEVQVSVTYPLIVDPDFAITDTYTNFLVPLTILIDKGGVIRYIHTGFEKGLEKEYEAAVKKLLGS
jgi:peroxiredoxin